MRGLHSAIVGGRSKGNGPMRRFMAITYLLKERSAGAIPPCRELLAMIGLDTYRRKSNAVLHKVPKEPLKE